MSAHTPELLPCPFCGETPDIANPATFQDSQGTKYGSVVCCCTGPEVRTGYGPVEDWRDDAIEAWNDRAGGWQPIETAPKTGEEILVSFGGYDGPCPLVLCWNGHWELPDMGLVPDAQPTHWMPLPSAPSHTPTSQEREPSA